MKFKLFDFVGFIGTPNRRRIFMPSLCIGPVMWRCTNGRENHAVEWNLNIHLRGKKRHYGPIPLTPVLQLRPWERSCLASMDELGTTYHSGELEACWLWYKFELVISKKLNAKTQQEVDAATSKWGL